MVIRYVISHMSKDGLRYMTYACQGRNTKATRKEAEQDLKDFLTDNTQERLEGIFGTQATGTFEVSAVQCYPNHFDPLGPVIQEAFNPNKKCMSDELKEFLDNVEGELKMKGLHDESSVGSTIKDGMNEALKMLEISGNIQEIAAEQYQGKGMSIGDYQGAIEAQVLIAIQYGIGLGKGEAL
jgi:hypothetical protein